MSGKAQAEALRLLFEYRRIIDRAKKRGLTNALRLYAPDLLAELEKVQGQAAKFLDTDKPGEL